MQCDTSETVATHDRPFKTREESSYISTDSSLWPRAAIVILNADDWGLNSDTTGRIFECAQERAFSCVSAMVFMDDSERAACLAREHDIDAGLHLNFTCGFTTHGIPSQLREHHQRIASFLHRNTYTRILFNPLLVNSFDYVTKAQIEEFERLYGAEPTRVDGHHHMHLCANVLLQKLLPEGTIVRRNQSFAVGEKGRVNRWYRRMQDQYLSKHHPITDYFFDILPMECVRLRRILELAREFKVEFEAHANTANEYRFLRNRELVRCAENVIISHGYQLHASGVH